MISLILVFATVLIGATAFFIHVGKTVERRSYAPFRKRIETFRKKDTAHNFSIIGVLM
ncbi:MAG: hypothetical protein LUF25_04520 [Phascolarctobacterium sp.]|nr:hypothetical protein [Phascolarctobacterium sp.]